MDLESWSQPGRGLREYFRRVADACGSGEAGWRAVLEPVSNNDLVTLSYLNSSVCPPPEEVAEFAANPGGGATTPVTTTEDVFELLSDYAVVRMRPIAG